MNEHCNISEGADRT